MVVLLLIVGKIGFNINITKNVAIKLATHVIAPYNAISDFEEILSICSSLFFGDSLCLDMKVIAVLLFEFLSMEEWK